jgi:hypothetical protein
MKIERTRHKYVIPENWNKYKQQTYDFLYERHQKIRRPRKAEWVLQRIVCRVGRLYRLNLLEKQNEN